MKCPTCGEGKLVHETRDVSYTYKGETTTFPNVTADYCTACDEYLTAPGEMQRVMDMMKEFNAQVNAALVDPNDNGCRRFD